MSNDTLFISLGSTCGIAYQLQKLGLKKESLPFDWVKSDNMTSICHIIKNGFDSFGEFSQLELQRQSTKHPVLETDDWISTENTVSYVYRNKIGIQFFHDFPDQFDSETSSIYINFKNKYIRRFDRFYGLFSSGKKLVFIRDEFKPNKLSRESVEELIDLLVSMLSNNTTINFILCIHNPSNKSFGWIDSLEKNYNFIKIIIDNNKFNGWQRDNLNWKEILLNE